MVASLRDVLSKMKLQSSFYLHFQKISTKFREELKRSVAIQFPTHRDLDWLLRGVLHTHDYTVVIRQARWPPREKRHTHTGSMTRIPPKLSGNGSAEGQYSGADRSNSRVFFP